MTEEKILEQLGYTPRWQALFAIHDGPDMLPGRIIRSDRGSALAALADGVRQVKPSTNMLKSARSPADLPTVGDWVAVYAPAGLDVLLVEAVLDRVSVITRGDPGGPAAAQALAANVDSVFLVHSLEGGPNLRRIERELALVWSTGAMPVVVLTKSDLADDADIAVAEVEAVAAGADVLLTSARNGQGVELILDYIPAGKTAVLLGPSGAGKSTLINALLGDERQETREVRLNDLRGRHTTVTRELVRLPDGGLIIDTPGLRALSLTGSETGIAAVFPDIEEAAQGCRFRDCSHNDEPGCAVRAAIQAGTIDPERLINYHKLMREAALAAARFDDRLRSEENRRQKVFSKVIKEYQRLNPGKKT